MHYKCMHYSGTKLQHWLAPQRSHLVTSKLDTQAPPLEMLIDLASSFFILTS